MASAIVSPRLLRIIPFESIVDSPRGMVLLLLRDVVQDPREIVLAETHNSVASLPMQDLVITWLLMSCELPPLNCWTSSLMVTDGSTLIAM